MKRTPLTRKQPLKAKTGLKSGSSLKTTKPLKAKAPIKKKASPNARSKIRQSARGKPCLVRLPGICNGNPETTVAAHLRVAGTCGMGMKPSDLLTVRACSACHDEIDRRTRQMDLARLTIYVHEAHCRTLVEYEKEGLISQT